MVVGEDRAGPVPGPAGCLQVVGGAVHGVGLVVDVRWLPGRIARGVDFDRVPGVAGLSADADLHRPGGSRAVGARVNAWEGGGVERRLHVVDCGEDRRAAIAERELCGCALEDRDVGRRDPADGPARPSKASGALRLGCADRAQREHHGQQGQEDGEREREQPQPSHRGSRLQGGDQPAAVAVGERQQECAGVGPILL